MVGESKILTVSYGTFSCTLEGFDEPFSTMKAIAEYFRDLAAEDRYFGAEPPVPDADMLHRIAEREVQRRVEAKVQENGVVLRAGEQESAKAPAPQPAPVPPAAPAPVAEVAPQPAVQAPAAEIIEAPATAPESVAARLQRIRAAAEAGRQALAAVAPVVTEQPNTSFEEEEPDTAFENTGSPANFAQDFALEIDDLMTVETVAEVELTETVEPAPLATPEQAEIEAEEANAADDAQIAAPEAAPADVTAPSLEDTISSVMAASVLEEASSPEIVEIAEEEPAEEEPVLEAPQSRARVIKVRRIDSDIPGGAPRFETYSLTPEEAEAEARAEEARAAAAPLILDTPAEEVAEETAEEFDAEEPVEIEAPAPITLELDEDEDEDEDSFEIAAQEEAPAEAEEDDQILARIGTSLSDEDEDDLMAELAMIEREALELRAPEEAQLEELTRTAAAPEVEAETAELDEEEPEEDAFHDLTRASILRQHPVSEEDAMDRLMQQADSELTEPENRRRLATIAHLKAAVAATEADKELSAKEGARQSGPTELDRYRDDLAQAVRPRRPVTSGASTTRRPSTQPERPAPLVLVSEQRIDKPAASANDPMVIRPRRVSTGNLALTQEEISEEEADDGVMLADAKSFADFAEKLGATELPDLLEAAAAYASCVEGRPHFSRPQIMRSAASIAEGDVSREASLRSFGMLLRQGKIQKIKRGQFAISETSRFLPEARKAAK